MFQVKESKLSIRIKFVAFSRGGAASGWCGEWSIKSSAIVHVWEERDSREGAELVRGREVTRPNKSGDDCIYFASPVNKCRQKLSGGREVAKARRPAVNFCRNPKRLALDLSCSKQRIATPSGLLS
jgi:hypothetical protein